MQQDSPLTENEATPQESPIDGSSLKITRKTHRKSRAGCKNCKNRRIKCDEAKPHCSNCTRREARCEYAVWTSLDSEAKSKSPAVISGDLPVSEIELTYHWTTSTCFSLSSWSAGATHWQSMLDNVALHHQHVLCHLFALTAFHLASCRPERQAEYKAKAELHYSRALAMVTPEIANLSADNCDAVLLSVQLICFVALARGPQPGEYLAFGEHGRSEWLVMFRGIRTTLDSLGRDNIPKSHAGAIRAKGRPLPISSSPLDYEVQLKELYEHVAFVTAQETGHEDNVKAVTILKECYDSRYKGQDSEYHVVFAWLYRMTDAFLDQLQQREPIPLVIYAHFVVLMHEMERFWYMQGWTRHVMQGIFNSLQTEHRTWIRWPMAQIGWIAT